MYTAKDRYYPASKATQKINVSPNSVPNIPENKPMSFTCKTILTVTGVIIIIIAACAAIGIPFCVSLGKCTAQSASASASNGSATTVIATTVIATTVTTTTVTTTTGTTTSTTGTVATGTQNYAIELTGNGYHGIQKVRYYSATNTGSAMRFGYPIVYLSGTTFSGSYVNNAWYALHAGCGNVNGIADCTGVCKAISKTYVGITSSCGTGYPGSITSYVSPDCCVYTSADTVSTPWNDYGTASGCGNPMIYCDCTL